MTAFTKACKHPASLEFEASKGENEWMVLSCNSCSVSLGTIINGFKIIAT
jgi:hypothetical protein